MYLSDGDRVRVEAPGVDSYCETVRLVLVNDDSADAPHQVVDRAPQLAAGAADRVEGAADEVEQTVVVENAIQAAP